MIAPAEQADRRRRGDDLQRVRTGARGDQPGDRPLYQPTDLNVIDYNQVGTAMLQDAIWARDGLARAARQRGHRRRASCAPRSRAGCTAATTPATCVQYTTDAGSTLGAGHQAWMMNEINPLVWPSPNGIGAMPVDTWEQTVQIAKGAKIIPAEPDSRRIPDDLAAARSGRHRRHQGRRLPEGHRHGHGRRQVATRASRETRIQVRCREAGPERDRPRSLLVASGGRISVLASRTAGSAPVTVHD